MRTLVVLAAAGLLGGCAAQQPRHGGASWLASPELAQQAREQHAAEEAEGADRWRRAFSGYANGMRQAAQQSAPPSTQVRCKPSLTPAPTGTAYDCEARW